MEQVTDYQRELQQIERDIAQLEPQAFSTPLDAETTTKFAYRLYQRASLLGNLSEFEPAAAAIDKALGSLGPAQDLCLLKANLEFKFHRLEETRRALELAPGLLNTAQGRTLDADIAFQQGKYDYAKTQYEKLIEEERSWDNLARLAFLQSKLGEFAVADELYEQAENEITAKEMKSFSWVELQRGLLDLTHGRFEAAAQHYQRANRGYTGHWLVDEHIAELLGAQGKFTESAALYEQVIERVPKPELQQALGELYTFIGRPEQAEPWYNKALQTYMESAKRGHVHYYHHLADFYADVRQDAAEALKWSQMDLQLRENYSTQAAFAWALYLNHRYTEALDTINRALSSGIKEAGVFATAGIIYKAAGRNDEGEQYLHLAAHLNPKHQSFHVHH